MTMPYPTHDEFTAIAREHHLSFPEAVLTPWIGATRQVLPLGDYLIKVPFDDSVAIQAVMTDASVDPLVHGLGIPTQELLILDDSRETLVVPFSIFRRVQPAVFLDHFAGHLVGVPYQPVAPSLGTFMPGVMFGGSAHSNAIANANSWAAILAMLDARLKSPS